MVSNTVQQNQKKSLVFPNSRASIITPYKTNLFIQVIPSVIRQHPIFVGGFYFIISFCGIILLGKITGQWEGKNDIAPMYSTLEDNFNLAILAPIGAGLLCNFYRKIEIAFTYLKDEGFIGNSESAKYDAYIQKLEGYYNSAIAVALSFIISLIANIYNYSGKDDWLGIGGGITAIYARFFIILNFFIICLVIYQFFVTIWATRTLFKDFDVHVEPMHPDGAAGLQPVGDVAFSISAVVALILAYFSIMLVFDAFAADHIIYKCIFWGFYILSPIFLFATLSGANSVMTRVKKTALEKLRLTFDEYYEKLNTEDKNEPYNLKVADEITKIYGLYEIVSKMPVWPFDTRTVVRFLAAFGAPLILYLVDLTISNHEVVLQGLGWCFFTTATM